MLQREAPIKEIGAKPNPPRREVRTVRKSLRSIAQSLANFPIPTEPLLSIDEFSNYGRDPKNNRLTYAPLSDGMAILYSTQQSIDKLDAHRFVIPTDERKVAYHREEFDKECRDVGIGALDLSGIREIATNPEVVSELVFIMSVAERHSFFRWTDLGAQGLVSAILLDTTQA